MKKNQTLTSRIRTFLLVLLACTMTGNVQARKTNDSSPSPQAVRKRHFEAYHSWQSRYCDST